MNWPFVSRSRYDALERLYDAQGGLVGALRAEIIRLKQNAAHHRTDAPKCIACGRWLEKKGHVCPKNKGT